MASKHHAERRARAKGIFEVTTRRMKPVTETDAAELMREREEYLARLERDEAAESSRAKRFDVGVALVICVLSIAVAWFTWGHR